MSIFGTAASSSSSSAGFLRTELWEGVRAAIISSPRAEAIARGDDPPELAPLLDKVRRHAYRIVDGDVAGLDTDVVLEAVLAASLAEGDQRRRVALQAIG